MPQGHTKANWQDYREVDQKKVNISMRIRELTEISQAQQQQPSNVNVGALYKNDAPRDKNGVLKQDKNVTKTVLLKML